MVCCYSKAGRDQVTDAQVAVYILIRHAQHKLRYRVKDSGYLGRGRRILTVAQTA